MASSSKARSSGPVFPSSFTAGGGGGHAYRSSYSGINSTITPNRHSYSSSSYGAGHHGFASYSFSTAPTHSPSPAVGGFFTRSASPTRVNLPQSSSVRVSLDSRSISPRSRPLTNNPVVVRRTTSRSSSSASSNAAVRSQPRRTCMCSPTTHPGSFRCALHKNMSPSMSSGGFSASNRLNARRSAMTNSLVRIGTVEGDLVKRALAALIRPSSHQQRRRAAFQPKPSRLSAMARATEDFTGVLTAAA